MICNLYKKNLKSMIVVICSVLDSFFYTDPDPDLKYKLFSSDYPTNFVVLFYEPIIL